MEASYDKYKKSKVNEDIDTKKALSAIVAKKDLLRAEIESNEKRRAMFNTFMQKTGGKISFQQYHEKGSTLNATGFEAINTYEVNKQYKDALNKQYEMLKQEYDETSLAHESFLGFNGDGGQDDNFNWTWGGVVKAVATGGLSETDAFKKAEDTAAGSMIRTALTGGVSALGGGQDLTSAKTILTGGLSNTEAFKKLEDTKAGGIFRTALTGGLSATVYKDDRRTLAAVSTGGMTEEQGRRVYAALATGGISETAKGKAVFGKFDTWAVNKWNWINLSCPRVCYMGLLRINFWGLASDLKAEKDKNSDRWQKALAKWKSLGGMAGKGSPFFDAIQTGAKEKPFTFWFKVKGVNSFDGEGFGDYLNYREPKFLSLVNKRGEELNEVSSAVVAASIAAASSIVVAICNAMGKKPSAANAADYAATESEANSAEAQANLAKAQAAENEAATGEFDEQFAQALGLAPESNALWWVLGIAGLILVGGVTAFLLAKKKQ